MASALQQLTKATVNIEEEQFKKLIRESEQLRILKNYCKLEEVITKGCIETLVKAMEAKDE
jgi:hypothetical protein